MAHLSMWDPPGPGIEPVSPALVGGFFISKEEEEEVEEEKRFLLPEITQLISYSFSSVNFEF